MCGGGGECGGVSACAYVYRGYVNQLFLLRFRQHTSIISFPVFTRSASVDFIDTQVYILTILPFFQPGTLNSFLTF